MSAKRRGGEDRRICRVGSSSRSERAKRASSIEGALALDARMKHNKPILLQ